MRNTNEILKNPKVWDHKPDFFMHRAMVKLPDCGTCSVVWSSNEGGYEHVSVSPKKKFRIPTWDDMCALKDIFFEDEEEVYQIHPKKSHYVNLKDNCLHLWKPKDHELDDLLEMETGWVPVAEKLPEPCKWVMATVKSHRWISDYEDPAIPDDERVEHPETTFTTLARYGKEGLWQYMDSDVEAMNLANYADPEDLSGPREEVIAWMPLPDPYESIAMEGE